MMPRENANVSNFSDMQKHVYVKAHSEQPCHTNPLLLIIIAGIRGTGKSYLCLRSKRSRTSRTKYQAARRSFHIRDAREMGREQKGRGKGVGERKEGNACPQTPLF